MNYIKFTNLIEKSNFKGNNLPEISNKFLIKLGGLKNLILINYYCIIELKKYECIIEFYILFVLNVHLFFYYKS